MRRGVIAALLASAVLTGCGTNTLTTTSTAPSNPLTEPPQPSATADPLEGPEISDTPEPPTTSPKKNCDPNYSGACVPIASDVDCAGGSGNGPAYVQGPVRVVGDDIYDLDRDGDGTACDT
jgi:hypothetical protein